MGCFIETARPRAKAEQILAAYPDAIVLPGAPASFADVPADKGLVCVVENPGFDAAAFVYDAAELERCQPSPGDVRKHTYLLMDRAEAERISNFAEFKSRLPRG